MTSSIWELLFFGLLTLIYGVFKLFVCFLELTLSKEQKHILFQQMPFLQRFVTLDVSTAGKTLSLVYVVFALITILKATERIWTGSIHKDVNIIINERLFIYMMYGLIGVFLFGMYYMVVYTNINIDKDTAFTRRYKLLGVSGGLVFIASVPILLLLHHILDHGIQKAFKQHLLTTSLILACCILTIWFVVIYAYKAFSNDEKNHHNCNITWQEILTLLIIPTNIL